MTRGPAPRPDGVDDLTNLLPAAHGGVVMTLLDVAMARAATSQPDAPSTTVVTVEMSVRSRTRTFTSTCG